MNDQKNINAIRFLGIDAITNAKSGHPGIVLGASPMIYTLFTRHLNFSVKNPNWINRDRFVLSPGHGSAMLYAIMHLLGYPEISINELKKFRQLGSKTPGFPEKSKTQGIECTTGPLGIGISTALGMALNERLLSEQYNQKDQKVIDHYTYVITGDGCLQEGVSEETISLAGTWKLNKYIVLYDSNDVQLNTRCELVTISNVKQRFQSQGWDYILVKDGTDVEAIDQAIIQAKKNSNPTLIEIKTIIGSSSPNQDSTKVHGTALTAKELAITRKNFQWEYPMFTIPQEVYDDYQEIVEQKEKVYQNWNKNFTNQLSKNKKLEELVNYPVKEVNLQRLIQEINPKKENLATREMFGNALLALETIFPTQIVAGSADAASTTYCEGHLGIFNQDDQGNAIKFGVREFAMGNICAGVAMQNHYWISCSTILAFVGYIIPAIRSAALMNAPVTYIFTHDSILIGQDGPTHQPIEQIEMLRDMPNVIVFRPCDATETAAAFWFAKNNKKGPTVLIGSKQALPYQQHTNFEETILGAYILEKEKERLVLTIIGSGSEVALAQQVKKEFKLIHDRIRIVSMPSFDLFYQQSPSLRKNILGKPIRIFLEASTATSYYRLKRDKDIVIGLNEFGISGVTSDVQKSMKFDSVSVYNKIKLILQNRAINDEN